MLSLLDMVEPHARICVHAHTDRKKAMHFKNKKYFFYTALHFYISLYFYIAFYPALLLAFTFTTSTSVCCSAQAAQPVLRELWQVAVKEMGQGR